jgi:hypothetical protein
MMSPGHPEPSLLAEHPPAEPSGSRYIRSREMLPPEAASATYRLPIESTAMPLGPLRVASLVVLPQLFDWKPPLQVPNARFAVWPVIGVSGELYSNTAAGLVSEM